MNEKKGLSIRLYTDASFYPDRLISRVAFYGTCPRGGIAQAIDISAKDINFAEMYAILFAVKSSIALFQELKGIEVFSDNLACVEAFHGKNCPASAKELFERVQLILCGRWFTIAHVRAHTGGADEHSIKNDLVDRMAGSKYANRI